MAEPRPSGIRNFFGRIGDRLVPGNNYNPQTGQWTATPGQYAGAVGGVVGNLVMPGSGTLIRSAVNGATTGNGLFGFLHHQQGPVPAGPTSPAVIPFSPTFTQSGPVGFDPNTTTPASTPSGTNQAPQLPFTLTATQSGPVRNNFFGPTPFSGLTGVAA